MKKIIYILCIIVLCIHTDMHAQKETSWWYFGLKSGLNFNSLQNATADDGATVPNMPKAITGPVNTFEGCFTVSTYDGQFLFASDGITVYNKNQAVMPNGTGLMGNPSATQSGIVIPRPGSTSQYYVVTVDYVSGTNGVRYSIVDMELDAGLGDVIPASKNTIIKSGVVGENIAAVPNSNGQDYWLLHRTGTDFFVFAVTSVGISSTPHQTISDASINNPGLGALVVSSDYTKLLSTNWSGRQLISAEFNPLTGLISDIKTENIPVTDIMVTYGAAFSPNSKYTYVTTAYYDPQVYVNTWDNLRAGIPSTYLAHGPSNLQAGIDGRLYGIQSVRENTGVNNGTKNLFVIMNPDNGGNINHMFTDYLINNGFLGVPSFPAGFIRITPDAKPFACASYERTYGVEIDLSGGSAPVKLEWNFGDGTPITTQTVSLTQTEYTMKHAYATPGVYTISVTPYKVDGTKVKAITMEANIVICTLKSNLMTRSALLNSKEQE